ncbi:hypothetical protein K3495_g11028, partial [Podosphaera aphanis]
SRFDGLDSAVQVFTEQLETPNEKDVEEFKKAFQSRFPAKFSAVKSEDLIEEDIGNLKQGSKETLLEYYGRAQHLSRRIHAKDTPPVAETPLSTVERILLKMMIKAFIRGLYEMKLRKLILTRTRPTSLQEAFEVDKQAPAGMKEIEKVEKVKYDRMEVEIFQQQYVGKHGKSLK